MSAPQYDPKRNPQQPSDPESKKRKKYPLSEDRGRDKRHESDREDRERDDDQRPDEDEHRMLGGEA